MHCDYPGPTSRGSELLSSQLTEGTDISCSIIRITFTVPVFAVVAFLSLVADSHAGYLSPLSNLYEAWALCGFLLLLCAWIAPTEAELEAKLAENGKLAMYNVSVPLFAFQYSTANKTNMCI